MHAYTHTCTIYIYSTYTHFLYTLTHLRTSQRMDTHTHNILFCLVGTVHVLSFILVLACSDSVHISEDRPPQKPSAAGLVPHRHSKLFVCEHAHAYMCFHDLCFSLYLEPYINCKGFFSAGSGMRQSIKESLAISCLLFLCTPPCRETGVF